MSTPTMSKKTNKINNPNEYKKSSFKDIMEDTEDTKNKALKSVPKVKKEQTPSDNETSKETLYGGDGDGNKDLDRHLLSYLAAVLKAKDTPYNR
jgi:hypothetical protein